MRGQPGAVPRRPRSPDKSEPAAAAAAGLNRTRKKSRRNIEDRVFAYRFSASRLNEWFKGFFFFSFSFNWILI